MTTTLVAFDCGGSAEATPPFTAQDARDLHRIECALCAQYLHCHTIRDEQYRDIAIMADARVSDLQRHPERDFPLEISGDALALHTSEKDNS